MGGYKAAANWKMTLTQVLHYVYKHQALTYSASPRNSTTAPRLALPPETPPCCCPPLPLCPLTLHNTALTLMIASLPMASFGA